MARITVVNDHPKLLGAMYAIVRRAPWPRIVMVAVVMALLAVIVSLMTMVAACPVLVGTLELLLWPLRRV